MTQTEQHAPILREEADFTTRTLAFETPFKGSDELENGRGKHMWRANTVQEYDELLKEKDLELQKAKELIASQVAELDELRALNEIRGESM